ncbi:hypothetical protein DB346_13445 [Verrucomicrobia bacterium LW23]|nr:hypothetical protein DB346_13445 [Verrucomicrobia bacterium LW23]
MDTDETPASPQQTAPRRSEGGINGTRRGAGAGGTVALVLISLALLYVLSIGPVCRMAGVQAIHLSRTSSAPGYYVEGFDAATTFVPYIDTVYEPLLYGASCTNVTRQWAVAYLRLFGIDVYDFRPRAF